MASSRRAEESWWARLSGSKSPGEALGARVLAGPVQGLLSLPQAEFEWASPVLGN